MTSHTPADPALPAKATAAESSESDDVAGTLEQATSVPVDTQGPRPWLPPLPGARR